MAAFRAVLEGNDKREKFSRGASINNAIAGSLLNDEIDEISEGTESEHEYTTAITQESIEEKLISSIPYEPSSQEVSSSITYEIQMILKSIISMGMKINKIDDIVSYLFLYPDMIDILPTICHKVLDRVETDNQVYLQVYHDPEIEDKYLTVLIRSLHYDENVINLIDSLGEECLELIEDKSGWLIITTDFRDLE